MSAADVSSDVETIRAAALKHAERLRWLGYPEQVAEAERIKAAAARAAGRENVMREALEAVEWSGYSFVGMKPCPSCGNERVKGHASDCIVRAALDEAGEGASPNVQERATTPN